MAEPSFHALVADDEEALRQLTIRALEREGIACDGAADGGEAMELIRSRRYDVVVTDLRMPVTHGHALCLELLGKADRPRVVVLTGVLEPRLTADLAARGADLISFKPVKFKEFAAQVKSLVDPTRESPRPAGRLAPPAGAAVRRGGSPAEPVASDALSADDDEEGAQSAVNAGLHTKHVVVILLRDQETSQALARELASSTVKPLVVPSSERLHQILHRQRVELVVIDNELGGFLNGIEIIERLHSELLRPEVVLLARSRADVAERAKLMGIENIASPQDSVETIAERIRGVFAVKRNYHGFIPYPARRLVTNSKYIPPLPQLVVKLVTYLDMPNDQIPIRELAKDISVDPRATSELLKLTNSTSVGLRREITKVFDAVNLLGTKRTIALILSSATVGAQDRMLRGSNASVREWYHRRSVLTASTASVFAQKFEDVSSDTAFVLGLLQDIGILTLNHSFPNRYPQLLQRFRSVGPIQLAHSERDDFSTTHAEVSAALLQHWGLPQSLICLILDHHATDQTAKRSKIDEGFLRVMRIGEALANLSDLRHPMRCHALNRLLKEYGDERQSECGACVREAVARAVDSCALFAIPAPDEATINTILKRVSSLNDGENELEESLSDVSPQTAALINVD